MGWLRETSKVVAVEPDGVWIEADRSALYGKCAARAGCGQGTCWPFCRAARGASERPPEKL